VEIGSSAAAGVEAHDAFAQYFTLLLISFVRLCSNTLPDSLLRSIVEQRLFG
jgi:hypothetical protein